MTQQVERLVRPSTCDVVDTMWQLLLYDESVQFFGLALLVVVGLLGKTNDSSSLIIYKKGVTDKVSRIPAP